MNRLSRRLSILIGRDKETAEERAFRHERKGVLISLLPVAITSLCIALIFQFAISATLIGVIQTLAFGLIVEIVLFSWVNSILKWHQNKYGGD